LLGVILILVWLPLLGAVYTYTRAGQGTRVEAATASTLNFQARLMNNTGGLVADGSYSVQFKLYTAVVSGTNEWTETQTVTVKNGYFNVYLGSVTPFPGSIDWSQEKWLTMNVNSDGEMTPRIKLTATPYSFRSGQADSLTITGGTITGDNLFQKAPGAVQSVSSTVAGLRMNQTGSGGLLQLQGNGSDVFTVDKAGNTAASGSLSLGAGLTLGNSASTTAGTIRWSGSDFEGYNGVDWISLTAGSPSPGGPANVSTTFVSGVQNQAANATNQLGLMVFTSNTAVSATNGTNNSFIAPASGSFRACTMNNNANITSGTAQVRWRVNGATVGSGACVMTNAVSDRRLSATTIDPGVVTFNAGDVIAVAVQSTGLAPATLEFTVYWTVEYNSSATIPSDAFVQGGNSFGSTAELGTTDNFGLALQTQGTTRIGITAAGNITFNNIADASNGLIISGGGLDLSGTQSITNIGSNVTGAGALTLASGGGGDLILDSASDVLVLSDSTLRRLAAGSTTIELNDSSDTTLSIANTNGSAVANLNVEGGVTALSFSGSGAGLTALDAGAISSGVLNDGRLSNNVALLNASQTFTGRPTFADGLVLGNSASTTAGTIRWNGTAFQGYDGIQWISLSGGNGSSSPGQTTITKTANEIVNNSVALQDDDELAVDIGANETWAFRFVVQANAATAADLRFAVTAPTGATCRVGFIDPEGASSNGQYGCGVSTAVVPGNGAVDVYEIVGTVTSGATAGTIRLQWAQFTANASNATVYAGSYVLATINGGGMQFLHGGNTLGQTAILGTKDNYGINFITNNTTALALSASGDAMFNGMVLLNSGASINGGINNNSGGITNAGNIDGVNGLTFTSGNLTLNGGDITGGGLIDGTSLTVSGTITGNTTNTINGLSINGGALSDITTLSASGAITAATATNTINGLIINSGSLSGITGFSQTSGTFSVTGSGAITLGSGSNTLTIDSSNFDVSSAGALSGISTLSASGAITAATATNTINGLVVNSGSLSAITGFNQTSGNFAMSGTGTFGTGSGAVNLNGATTITTATNSANALTVNGTSGTAADALRIAQTGNAGNLTMTNTARTTGALISLTHSTSAFTGTGLLFNFASGSGSFASGNFLDFQLNGTSRFRVDNSGALQIRSDSATALQVMNAAGALAYLTVNSSGNLVQVGSSTADATGILMVLDSKTGTDPTPVNGGSYYNSTNNKARCVENGIWTDCITNTVVGETTLGTAGNTITVTLNRSVEYLHCRVDAKGRSAAALVYMRFNGDTGAAAYGWNMYGIATNAVIDAQDSSDSELQLNGTTTGTVPFSADINITNFADTRKAVDWTAIGAEAIGTDMNRYSGGGTWNNTAAQITSVSFVTSAGNFTVGSHAWCEGRNVR